MMLMPPLISAISFMIFSFRAIFAILPLMLLLMPFRYFHYADIIFAAIQAARLSLLMPAFSLSLRLFR